MRHLSLSFVLAAASFAAASAAYTPPCTLAIDSQEVFETQWVTVDANNDGAPYIFRFNGNSAYYTQNKGKAADDWVISPAVELKAGVTYNIVATVQNVSTYASDKDNFKVCAGTAQTVDAMTDMVFKVENLSKSSYPEDKEGRFTPSQSGEYFFGLNLYSGSYMGDFKLVSFRIEALSSIPAAAADLSVTAAPLGEMRADLSWKWPAVNTFGGELTSIGGAYVYRGTSASFAVADASRIATVSSGVPGEVASYSDTSITEPGDYYYKVVPFNENGVSTSAPASAGPVWVGPDKSLQAVTGLTATLDPDNDRRISLTWNQPVGTNGGYVNLANVAYTISRSKDGAAAETLEEAWKGELPYVDSSLAGLGSYTYTVRTLYNGSAGFASATSNAVVAGGTMALPYSNSFDAQSSVALFTFFNAADVTRGWTYSSSKKALDYWGGSKANAWAVLPVFALEAGKTYRFAFTANVSKAASPKNLAIAFGKEPSADALSEVVFSESIANTLGGSREFTFSVPADGNYYIGLHCFGDSDSNDLYVDDISLEATATAPLPVADAVAEAAEAGALKAIVKWSNPTRNTAGSDLTDIEKVVVSYEGNEVASIENPAPGSESRVEIAVSAPGFCSYSIEAYSGGVASEAVSASTPWVGFDTPLAPASVSVEIGDDGRVISFQPVTAGVNGGYIDSDELRYIVSRNDDVLTTDLKESPFHDYESDLPLAVYTYSVKAINGDLTGEATSAAPVVLGDALELPYDPDFGMADTFTLWTLTNGWKYDASAKTIKTSNNDSWAFTPPIVMKQGTCAVSFRATCFNYRNQEDLKIYLVKDTDLPIATDALLVAEHHIESVSYPDLVTDTFAVDRTGTYYLAFGLDKTNWTLSISEMHAMQISEVETPDGVEAVAGSSALGYCDRNREIVSDRRGDLRIFNMQGALMMTAPMEAEAVSVAALPKGIYAAILIDSEGARHSIRFCKD